MHYAKFKSGMAGLVNFVIFVKNRRTLRRFFTKITILTFYTMAHLEIACPSSYVCCAVLLKEEIKDKHEEEKSKINDKKKSRTNRLFSMPSV